MHQKIFVNFNDKACKLSFLRNEYIYDFKVSISLYSYSDNNQTLII